MKLKNGRSALHYLTIKMNQHYHVWVFFIYSIKELLLVQQCDYFSKFGSEIEDEYIFLIWHLDDKNYNPAQNVWDTFSLFYKRKAFQSISPHPPPLNNTFSFFYKKKHFNPSPLPSWTMRVVSSHRCIKNILLSKDFNIVQEEQGKNLFLKAICMIKLLVSRSFHIKRWE